MYLAVAGRKRQTVQTGRVFQKMEAATGNEQTDGTVGCAAAA